MSKLELKFGAIFASLFMGLILSSGCVEEEEIGSEEVGTLEKALIKSECSADPRMAKIAREPDGGNACCGDNYCDIDERYTCPQDCVPTTYCGDGTCNGGESPSTCSRDCGFCGNNQCDNGETASSCARDCALPTRVLLEKVRSCRNNSPWPCNGATTSSEFQVWENAGVSKNHQKKTYITKLSEPAKSNVRHLVFTSAGQQNDTQVSVSWPGVTFSFNDTTASQVTGQRVRYKDAFGRKDYSKYVTIDRGLAHEVVETMGWPIQQTFAASAFDARFHFEFSKDEKGDIETAFYNWLKSKFDPRNIKSIYLGGFSRGGCLVARLGARFTAEFPNVPVIVHSFDGVCAQDGSAATRGVSEFGVTSHRMYSPVDGGGRAFAVNFSAQFSNPGKLAFFNQIGGQSVAFGARAFSDHNGRDETYSSPGTRPSRRPWLEQRWWNASHFSMEGWTQRNAAMNHLVSHCQDPNAAVPDPDLLDCH